MMENVKKDYDKADASNRARCEVFMGKYADDGHKFLDESKFRSEGRFATGIPGGSRVLIFAFKGYQLRVYGGLIPDRKIFVCTEIEIAKQRNTADQNRLKRAAKNLGKFIKLYDQQDESHVWTKKRRRS